MRVMFLSCLAALLTPFALAEDTEFFAVSSFGSMLIDRGEQLAAGVNETTLGVERVIGPGLLFADVYRITPLGADEEAFAEEVDYTLGYALPLGRHELVMAASWLTYPGSGGTESLELAGELVLDAPLSPVLIGLYDTECQDSGLEAMAGPSGELHGWGVYAVGRIGAVEPGEGESWTYYGAELGVERMLQGGAGIFGRLRWEACSQDLFADTITGSTVTHHRGDGLSLIAGLSIAY